MPSPAQRTLLFASAITSLLAGSSTTPQLGTVAPPPPTLLAPGVVAGSSDSPWEPPPTLGDVADWASKLSHAYLAGDVVHVVMEAAAAAWATGAGELSPSGGALASLWGSLQQVCRGYTPSLLRNVSSAVRLDCPTGAGWDDVVGLRDVCRQLQEVVVLPQTRPEVRAVVCTCAPCVPSVWAVVREW